LTKADGTFSVLRDYASPEGLKRFSGRIDTAGSTAMGLLINVLITFLVIILVLYLVNMLPVDGRAKQIIRIIVILIGVLYLLRYLAIF
jgi:hypothetical protein